MTVHDDSSNQSPSHLYMLLEKHDSLHTHSRNLPIHPASHKLIVGGLWCKREGGYNNQVQAEE